MERFSILSSDQKTQLAAYCVKSDAPRAMVQISHGMCEYFERYTPFAEFLAQNGFLVFGHDHLGHGNSAKAPDGLGFTVKGGGYEHMIEDVHNLSIYMKEQYPDLPLVLFGHSMGSFIAREVIARHGKDYTAAIICGTGGPETPAAMGKMLASILMVFQGERHRSKLLKKISFMGYNKKFGKGCDPSAWLTRDEEIVKRYNADPFCTYVFTLRAYHDLFSLVATVSQKGWASRIIPNQPILLISGEDDPVGGFGKGVRTVEKRLQQAGLKDLTTVLYPNMRHEILNELEKETVWKDILAWLESKLPLQN